MHRLLALVLAGTLLAGCSSSESDLQRGAEKLVATSDIPGVITLFEEGGHRTVVAAGYADLERRLPASTDGRFWIGSITKTFVATVVMQLVAEGRIGLDDTVEELLPGRLPEGKRIRVRNLLNHTSGIPDYMQLEPWGSTVARNPRAVIPARRLVSAAAKLPLEFAPGSMASYSNTNYLVLGEMLEWVTGEPIAQLLRKRIFAPLHLRATAFESGRRSLGPDEIHGYDLTGPKPRDVSLHRLGGPWADGALVSSAGDLATFIRALLRGELVAPDLVTEMTKIVPRSHGEGLGLFRLQSPCGRWYYGNTGGTPGYVTFAAASLDADRIVVISWNGVSPDAIHAMDGYLDKIICR